MKERRRIVRPGAGVVLSRSSLLGRPWPDRTLDALAGGYGWLPGRRRREGCPVTRARLAGQRAVALVGPQAARFFYDERHVQRHTALPGPVQATLFGRGAVQSLDGSAHRHRKAMLLDLLTGGPVADLVRLCGAAWDDAVPAWARRGEVVLFDEAAVVLTRGVREWAGMPSRGYGSLDLAADLVAMVDGFATAGPRHWRARRARGRVEAWVTEAVEDARAGVRPARPGSVLDVVSAHRGLDGSVLPARTAAVEIVNVLRPTVAVCWFVAFAAHALAAWPEHRVPLRSGDPAAATAFAHEVRRFYPFAPFIGGRAVADLTFDGVAVPKDALVLLDLYGQDHAGDVWPQPYRFDPGRFAGREPGEFDLVPQGAGDAATGHRCPGEEITVALLADLAVRLARLEYTLPPQDLHISLRRIPARPRSGVRIAVSAPAGVGRDEVAPRGEIAPG